MNEDTSSAATYCIACRRPIKIVSFYRADGFGPYCSDCADIKGIDPQMAITLPPATDSPITTVKLGEPIYRYPKPLRWRTGPVPDGLWVFYMWFLDGAGVDCEEKFGAFIGEGQDDGNIGGNFTTKWENARWLPLSEILDLIGE